jgi:hypothetical protein
LAAVTPMLVAASQSQQVKARQPRQAQAA